jgi:hypothetical protein
VVPAAIENSGNAIFASICMALLGGGLLALLLLNTALAQGAYTEHDLAVRSDTLADQAHELTNDIDGQRNPGALAVRAQQMGMVPATSMAFIRLSDGSIVGVAEPAKAGAGLPIVTVPKVAAAAAPSDPAATLASVTAPDDAPTPVTAPGAAPAPTAAAG